MANMKSRLIAPESASTKKRLGNTTKSLTGSKDAVKTTVTNETDSTVVMKRPSNLKPLTSDEKVQYFLQHGHLLKDKFMIKKGGAGRPKKNEVNINENNENTEVKTKSNNIAAKPIRSVTRGSGQLMMDLANPPLTRTKSGRIKKKNKDSLKLFDNILKSELMILDGSVENNSKGTMSVTNRVNNNNDNDITDQNSMMIACDDVSSTTENKYSKDTASKAVHTNKTDIVNSKNSKTKQDTLNNGDMLTLTMFECDHCKRVFNRKESLRRHMYLHFGMKPYACPFCKKKYRRHTNLESHVEKLHVPNMGNSEHYVCYICEEPFLHKKNLSLHMISHLKNENSFKCIYCNKKFSYHFMLIQHEKQHLVTGRYQCTLCNTSYECRNRLYLHVKSHLKIKDYICHACGKEFLRQNSMRRHVEICHGGHRIQCPICKKKLKGHLTEHMRTHDNKRPHECPECGQKFTQSTQLSVHRRCHSGARPYSCRICGRPFTHSNALMLHIRRHTGEKPFPCAMCPISFSQLPHMKAHMRKIHGKENPYKCIKCHQFFKLKVQLENHMKTCTVGDVEKSFEEKLNDSIKGEEMEIESVMSLSRMRFLLALLLTMIASKEKLKYLGFNKRLIDDLLVESLEAMGQTPCKDETLSPLMRLKTNIEMLMIGTVPKDQMEKFRNEKKTTEELLELLTSEK